MKVRYFVLYRLIWSMFLVLVTLVWELQSIRKSSIMEDRWWFWKDWLFSARIVDRWLQANSLLMQVGLIKKRFIKYKIFNRVLFLVRLGTIKILTMTFLYEIFLKGNKRNKLFLLFHAINNSIKDFKSNFCKHHSSFKNRTQTLDHKNVQYDEWWFGASIQLLSLFPLFNCCYLLTGDGFDLDHQ